MEAIAKHDFTATEPDELSFSKGATLMIINTDEDQNWFKAMFNGREGLIPNNYIDLKPNKWFVGKLKRMDAENLLLEKDQRGNFKHPDGAFLIRNSESAPGDFSMSVKFQATVQHFKIMRDDHKFHIWKHKFNSINELIDYHRNVSVNRQSTIFLTDMAGIKKVEAQYDFEPQEEGELKLKKGDTLTVTEQQDRNWWKGVNERTRQEGLFPSNYVKEV